MGRVSLETLLQRSEKNVGSGMRTMTEQAALYGKGRKSYVYKGKNYCKPILAKVTNA